MLKMNRLLFILLSSLFMISPSYAQQELLAFCVEKVTGYKADPKTGKIINPEQRIVLEGSGGTAMWRHINGCQADNKNNPQFTSNKNKDKSK